MNIENVTRGSWKWPYSSVYSYFENQAPDEPTYVTDINRDINTSRGMQYY